MFDVASLHPGLTALNIDIKSASRCQSLEGSGVGLACEVANGSAGKRWKFRIDAVGLWSKAEQLKVCHRYDHDLKGFVTMDDITRPVATNSSAAHLLGADGVREKQFAEIAAQNNGRISYEDFLKTVGLSANAGFARQNWELEPAVRDTGGSVSVALVPDPAEPFRNEVLVTRHDNSVTKLRGIGYAWRSDGSLISQELRGGEPVIWNGRSSTYGVGDEVEVEVDPIGCSVLLFVNGKNVASFPTIKTRGYRLGVQLHRARVTLLGVSDIKRDGPCQTAPGLKVYLRKPLEAQGIEKLSPLLGEEAPEVKRLGLRAIFRPGCLPEDGERPKKVAPTEDPVFKAKLEQRLADNRARRVCKPTS
jgi:hypothetical protein